MQPSPIPDTGTHLYRWSYPLANTPLSVEALRQMVKTLGPTDRLELDRLGGLEMRLRNETRRFYPGYYWAVGLDACYTPGMIDPEILVERLKKIVLGVPGFTDWAAP